LRHKLRVANIRHCRYCIPIHQAAQLSRADPGVSRAFLLLRVFIVFVPSVPLMLNVEQHKLHFEANPSVSERANRSNTE